MACAYILGKWADFNDQYANDGQADKNEIQCFRDLPLSFKEAMASSHFLVLIIWKRKRDILYSKEKLELTWKI